MLSAIITRLTGLSLIDYLRPRLFEPLGIENPFWEADPQGISLGGTGLHVRLDAIARFGQMYLQKGMWEGKRILSEAWIAEATSVHSDNSNTQTNPDWVVGYGYQFWRCRHNAYRGDGAFGQYCVVMPEQDVVLAINSGVRDLQAVLDKVWEHLLPALHADALPDDPQSTGALRSKLLSLSLPKPQGAVRAARGWGKRYTFEPNEFGFESVELTAGVTSSTLTVRAGGVESQFPVGYGAWLRGTSHLRGKGEEPVAASGAWTSDDTYEVSICYIESEFCTRVRFHYTSDTDVRVEMEPNIAWADPQPVFLTGHAEA
jgi:CubicO group peptidase (beta-lactamase class C family)